MRLRGTTFAAVAAALLIATPARAQVPTFANHAGPLELASASGEPSIGYNPQTGMAFFQANTNTVRVDFSKDPPQWTDASAPNGIISLDPILWTDPDTGRTFASQLLLFCSAMAFSDNDGASWLPSQGCGVGTLVDHQTVGGGPFAEGSGVAGGTGVYPNAVYYCAQAIASAQCAISRDGGLSFGPGTPIYTLEDCQGLHGHIKVSRDGTAYVPNGACGGQQGLAISRDNGTTWSVERVPKSTTQAESDPHLGIGPQGTLYFGFQDGEEGSELGRAMISVKPDGGEWRDPIDVGASLGVKNIQFAEVYAGDDDRAAFAFLGTPTEGNDQSPQFEGEWHLYVAMTYDQGRTWTTVDATPTDPVQRGCIWLSGGSNPCRNLLDFNDINMDREGRVLVGYADGCLKKCVTTPFGQEGATSRGRLGTIARQTGGLGLLKKFDPPGAVVPVGPVGPGGGGSGGGSLPAPGQPGSAACADPFSAAVVSGRASRLKFSFDAPPAGVQIFREARGRYVLKAKRVARLAAVRSGVARRVKRLRAGVYTARFGAIRVGFKVTRSGRVRGLGQIGIGRSCGAIRSVTLKRPVFGGVKRSIPLKVTTISEAGQLTVELLSGTKVIAAAPMRAVAAGVRTTVNLGSQRKLRRGTYKVRVSLRSGGAGHSASVVAVKL